MSEARPRYSIENLRWLEDDDGWYWVADYLRNGVKLGVTGNYYCLEERLEEPGDVSSDYFS